MAEFDQEGFDEISKANHARLMRLASMGIQIGGINEGYLGRLLEFLCEHLGGEGTVNRLKMEQQLWIGDQLDMHEKAIREQQLLAGVGGDIGPLAQP